MTFSAFAEQCARSFELCQADLVRRFKLGSYARYDWDQDTGDFLFSHQGEPIIRARFQFVGSLARTTWLWSWANPSLDERLTKDVRKVKEYGAARGYQRLTRAFWRALFVVFTEMKWVE